MKKLTAFLLAFLLVAITTIRAQEGQPSSAAASGGVGVISIDEAAGPMLSDTDQLRLEVRDWRFTLVNLQATLDTCLTEAAALRNTTNQTWAAEYDAELVAEIEAANPGYTFDLDARMLTAVPE